ncbi:hypothetical protein SAMN05216436_1442 [bacterium A37T11]|nr:hypothetical protein SAMN05216436_1442 [bacterium A37T11]
MYAESSSVNLVVFIQIIFFIKFWLLTYQLSEMI